MITSGMLNLAYITMYIIDFERRKLTIMYSHEHIGLEQLSPMLNLFSISMSYFIHTSATLLLSGIYIKHLG